MDRGGFQSHQFHAESDPSFAGIILFSAACAFPAAGLFSLLTLKAGIVLSDLTAVFFAMYAMMQPGMKNMMGNYTSLSQITACTYELDRTEGLATGRTSFVICFPAPGKKKLNEVNSMFGILPAVLNLYNLNYDLRLYPGADYFGDQEKVVYFPDGSRIPEHGIYYINNKDKDNGKGNYQKRKSSAGIGKTR